MKTNEVLENIKARRSVRAYTDRQVSEEDLQAILEAATFAPSGMHLETWHFTAIQNADKLAELNERIKGAFAKSDEPKLQERGHSKAYLLSCPDFGDRVQRTHSMVGRYGLCLRN